MFVKGGCVRPMTQRSAGEGRKAADAEFHEIVRRAKEQYDRDHDLRAYVKAVRDAGACRERMYSITAPFFR